jgi:hypothetical protein
LLAYYNHLPHGVIIILLELPTLKANTPAPSYKLMYELV